MRKFSFFFFWLKGNKRNHAIVVTLAYRVRQTFAVGQEYL